MLRRGAVVLLAIGLGSLGSDAVTRSFAAPNPVTFSTDWSAACTQCRAPIVSGGTVFTVEWLGSGPFNSTVRTFDAATGRPGWTYKLGKVDTSKVAAVGNGVVYVVSNRHDGPARVVALDAASGAVRWTAVPLRSASQISDVVLAGTGVFVVSGSNESQDMTVTRYDTTGARGWVRRQHRTPSDFAAAGGNLYVFSSTFAPPDVQHDFLTVYRESDGASSVVWRYTESSAGGARDVAVEHGLVYAVEYVPGEGTGFGTVAIDPTTGAFAWQVPQGRTDLAVGTHVVVSGFPQEASNSSELTGIDAATGAVLWGPISETGGNPALAGKAFYTTENHTVYAHSTATGAVRGTYTSAHDVFLDVSNADGQVYAAGAKELLSLTPSP